MQTSGTLRFSLVTLFAMVYVAASVLIVEKFAATYRTQQYQELSESVEAEALSVKSTIESYIHSDIYIANSLATLLTIDQQLGMQKFEDIAETLVTKGRFIRSIGVAEGYVIRDTYPLAGNEAAIGFDYRTVPEQFRSVAKAIQTQALVIAGPLELVQGGQAIIARYPIYSDFPENQTYWGMASIVLNINTLLNEAGLLALEEWLNVGMRGVDGEGASGRIFVGEQSYFDNANFLFDIELPDGKWQMAVVIPEKTLVSTGGIATHWTRIIGYSIALILAIMMAILWRAYRIANHMSHMDMLTDLPNRRFAMRALEDAEQKGRTRFGIIFIDLNGFKEINDEHGHHAGDHVLRKVGQLLRENVRFADIVARIGGDEFLVILPRAIEDDDISGLTDKLTEIITNANVTYNGARIPISLSAGYALFPDHGVKAYDLLKEADRAMYLSKARSRRKGDEVEESDKS